MPALDTPPAPSTRTSPFQVWLTPCGQQPIPQQHRPQLQGLSPCHVSAPGPGRTLPALSPSNTSPGTAAFPPLTVAPLLLPCASSSFAQTPCLCPLHSPLCHPHPCPLCSSHREWGAVGDKGEAAASSVKWGDMAPALRIVSWVEACSTLAQELRPAVVLGIQVNLEKQ